MARYYPDKPIINADEYAGKIVTPSMREALKRIRQEAMEKERAIRNSQCAPSTSDRHYPKVLNAPWKKDQ